MSFSTRYLSEQGGHVPNLQQFAPSRLSDTWQINTPRRKGEVVGSLRRQEQCSFKRFQGDTSKRKTPLSNSKKKKKTSQKKTRKIRFRKHALRKHTCWIHGNGNAQFLSADRTKQAIGILFQTKKK